MSGAFFTTVIYSNDEEWASSAYAYDNSRRGGSSDHVVIQLTLRGQGWFRDSRGMHSVPSGHAMLFSHDEATSYGCHDNAADPYVLRFVSAKIGGLGALFNLIRTDFGSVVNMPAESEATALLNELNARFTQRTFRDRFHESELFHHLLIALYREQVHATRTSDPIEFGYHYLRSHFRSPINLKLVAEKCGVSREHFIREFTERYNESPGGFLRSLRLDHARTMLAASSTNVESIALSSGYTSSNSFRRAYRQKFGRSPRAQ